MIGEPEKQAKSVIVDYGSGNLKSVFNAFKHASSGDVSVTHDFRDLSLSSHIILPGVGSFADCMKGLVSLPGVIETLQDEVIKNKKPFLGICVGMRLMASLGKENGTTKGLGWISGEVEKITPKDVDAHLFAYTSKTKVNVEKLEVGDTGFEIDSINEVINNLNQRSEELYYYLKEGDDEYSE